MTQPNEKDYSTKCNECKGSMTHGEDRGFRHFCSVYCYRKKRIREFKARGKEVIK